MNGHERWINKIIFLVKILSDYASYSIIIISSNSPGVDIALCELFGLASQLECSQPSEKVRKEY